MSKPDEQADLRRRLLRRVADTLEGYLGFHEQITTDSNGFHTPTFSQSIRIRALLDNKRIGVFDDTGVNGKTFTFVGSKFILDKETGKRNPALVVAPNCGMLNAWSEDEINRYAGYMNAPEQRVVTVSSYTDLARINQDTDFAVLNWEKLSLKPEDKRWQQLTKAIERMSPQIFGFDECHNAKGSSSLRAQTMRRLIEWTKCRYMMLLSATPIPNRYRDLGMVFHMLDPEGYANPSMFSHCAPDVMKELLDRQAWFRLTREDLKEELGLPELREVEVPVHLNEEEKEIYFKGWADCVCLGEGLSELRKTLYNSRLSKYGATVTQPPSKLERLAELVDELTARGEKVIIKTNYVNGVIDSVAEAVSKNREVLVVSGDTALDKRKIAYWQFRDNPKQKVLITSPVTEESVDLTTGETPVSLIALEPEMTPREFTQFTGRVYRRGQRGNVTHYSLVSQSSALDKMMVDYLGQLAEEYGIKVPKKFKPRTIDADMLAMRKAKEGIINKIYGGERITKKEESVYDANEIDRAVSHLEGLVTPSTFRSIKPFELSALIQTRWRNLGEEQFERLVRSRGWRKWRNMYEDGWEGSASQATNELIGKLVDEQERRINHKPIVVSIGDGRAYFSRATGRACVGIDLDEKWLEQGKKDCDKKKIPYKYVTAPATETTLPNSSVDTVVNAYTIFYLGQDDNRREVESCVLETNRVLKKGGEFVVALPYSIDDDVIKRWNEHMPCYGFKPTGYANREQTKSERMKNGCHILRYEKTKSVRKPQGRDISFYNNRRRFAG